MRLTEWLMDRAPRERAAVLVGGALGGLIVLYVLAIEPATQAISAREQRVHSLRQQLEWMSRMAAKAQTLRNLEARSGNASSRPPYVVVETSLQQSNLPTPDRLAPAAHGDAARLEFEQVPFDALVRWFARVRERHGLHVFQARIQGGENGQVSSQLTLRRAP